MADHNDLGNIGEQLAADYLQREGYELLESNWRYRRAEIDLIVKKEAVLIFVEVKTRRNNFLKNAERTINASKKVLLANAASAYMEHIGHEWEIRFDVLVIVYTNPQSYTIQHYEDAFFPGLEKL